MARTMSLRDANQQFARLIRDVAEGEEVVITRRGEPVARLVPFSRLPRRLSAEQALAAILEWPKLGAR
jgi:prevent-host-death family protein